MPDLAAQGVNAARRADHRAVTSTLPRFLRAADRHPDAVHAMLRRRETAGQIVRLRDMVSDPTAPPGVGNTPSEDAHDLHTAPAAVNSARLARYLKAAGEWLARVLLRVLPDT